MAENAPNTVAGSSSLSLSSSSEDDGMLRASGSPATEGAMVVPSSLFRRLPISCKMSSSLAMASARRHAKRERLSLLSVDCCFGAGLFPLLGMVLKKIEKGTI